MSSLKRKAADLAKDGKKAKPNGSITSFFKPPQAAAASTSASAPKNTAAKAKDANGTTTAPTEPAVPAPAATFDKEAWVAKLTDEQKELLKLEIDTLHDSWLPHLRDVLVSKQFLDLKRFLAKELASGKTVYPPMKDVYSWSRHTPLPTVKALILGQDPYHGPSQAHGLCFSVRPPTPAPPSLRNIYTALKKQYPAFAPPPNKGGLLTPWADRGVLMLNTCLTVRRSEANSHAGRGWEMLTQKVIDTVARVRTGGVVFLAWGKPAEGRVKGVEARFPGRHCILKSVHPSPLSASRGWFETNHFKECNEWLVKRYGEGAEIDWNLDVDPEEAGV